MISQIFALLNQMDLLSDFNPLDINGIFDSSLMYNKLSVGIASTYFWFIACLSCQLFCFHTFAAVSKQLKF
jgi:hypothetical protein